MCKRANPTKCSITLKEFVGKLPTNCLSVFDHFAALALKGIRNLLHFDVIAVILALSFVHVDAVFIWFRFGRSISVIIDFSIAVCVSVRVQFLL